MIQLYGLPMSNYYSLTKALLIEKGVDFEEVKAPPTQEEDNLARSPMGKMPSIGVDGRYMSESLAIASYLERLQPEPVVGLEHLQAGLEPVFDLIGVVAGDAIGDRPPHRLADRFRIRQRPIELGHEP